MSEEQSLELDLSGLAEMNYLPSLHDVHTILGSKIVGEDESRMALFSNWILARKYCLITGASRSGKTFIKDAIKDLIIGDVSSGGMCYTMKQGSQKSGWYAYEEIAKASFVDIPELNQLPGDMLEVLKTWGENKTSEYSVVETIRGQKKNRKMVLPYKPFVFAIADENNMVVPAELRYRLIEIRTDSSQKQTSDIIRSQAERELNPFRKEYSTKTKVHNDMKLHIKTLPLMEQVTFVNPAARFVAERVPKNFTDARTAHPVFQDGIKGVQRFYWKQSLIKEVDGKRVIFISPQAIMENYIINGRIFLNSVMKCNDVELELLNIIKNEGRWLDRKQLSALLRGLSINIRDSMIRKHLENLEEMNYIETRTTGQTLYYNINDQANMDGFYVRGEELLKHCEDVMREHHPEHFDDYVEAYLDRPTFIHPFTGRMIDLRTYVLGSEPKRISRNETLETETNLTKDEVFENDNEGISQPVIKSDIVIDDEEEEAIEEEAHEILEEYVEDSETYYGWLKSGKRIDVTTFIDRFGEEKMEEAIAKGDAYRDGDTISPLN